MSGPWLSWLMKAGLAAGAVYGVGVLTVGLPGAAFLDLVVGWGRKLEPDSAWPLAIWITMAMSLIVVPASLALRFVRPHLTGWGHAGATAAVTFVATVLFTLFITREPPARRGPQGLSGQVVFVYSPDANRIVVGSGMREFTLQFNPATRSVLLFSTPSDIDGFVRVVGVGKGQPLRFQSPDGTRFLLVYPGERVLFRNTSGYFMQTKIVSVKSKGTNGNTQDEVVFEYQINEGRWAGFSAL